MKKIGFALVSVAALGLAACGGGDKATNSSNSAAAATNEAIADVNAANSAEAQATTATNSALDARCQHMNSMAGNTAARDAAGRLTDCQILSNSPTCTAAESPKELSNTIPRR
jgi:hypothetical protein